MTKRFPYAFSIGTIALLAVFAALSALHAPAAMHLAVHWNNAGAPDAFAGPWEALFIPVALCAALIPVLVLLARLLEPDRQLVGFILVLMIVWEAMIAAPTFGVVIPESISPIMAVAGLFWILLGNSSPKSRPVRNKPQRRSEIDRLIASRRFGSRFAIVAGIVMLIGGLLPLDPATRHVVSKIAIWAIAILPPLFYSILWRQNGSSTEAAQVDAEDRDRPSLKS
jgi:uncharacterized membrane protein